MHLGELAPRLAALILPNPADGEVFNAVSGLLEMVSHLVVISQSCRPQVFLRSFGQGAASLTQVQHHCVVAAEGAHDGVYNIR